MRSRHSSRAYQAENLPTPVPINCYHCSRTHWTWEAFAACRMARLARMPMDDILRALGWDGLSQEEQRQKIDELMAAFDGKT